MFQDQKIARYEKYCEQLIDITYDVWSTITEIGFQGVDVGELDLAILPDTIQHVVFKNCIIPKVHTSIKLKNLTRLTIKESKLESFSIKKYLPNLSLLNLRGNKLTNVTIPDGQLFTLDVSHNQLKWINMNHQRQQMMIFDVGHNPELCKLPYLNTYISILGVENNPSIYPEVDVLTDVII